MLLPPLSSRFRSLTFALTLIILWPTASMAQQFFVRSGAGGGATGLDWANAFPSLPVTLVRGATYFVGAGSYGTYTFDTPASGDLPIVVRKATPMDHGTNTGWLDAYGAGAAVWDSVTFATSYWVFDGTTGGGPGSWTSGHGFVFSAPAGTAGDFVVLNDGVHHVTISRVSLTQTGDTRTSQMLNAVRSVAQISDSVFEYLYIDNISGLPFFMRNGLRNVFQYNYTGEICGVYKANVGLHCEAVVIHGMSNVDFRWNYIGQSPSSGGFVKNNSSTSDSVRIYGNIFRNGFPINCNTGPCTNWRIFNNTFASNLSGGPFGGDGSYPGLLYYNNLAYGGSVQTLRGTHGYNWYGAISSNSCSMAATETENVCVGCSSGCDTITEFRSPFVHVGGSTPEDLQLAARTSSLIGTNACLLEECAGEKKYDADMFGRTRGADGEWTKGALESPSGRPAPPTGIRIVR